MYVRFALIIFCGEIKGDYDDDDEMKMSGKKRRKNK